MQCVLARLYTLLYVQFICACWVIVFRCTAVLSHVLSTGYGPQSSIHTSSQLLLIRGTLHRQCSVHMHGTGIEVYLFVKFILKSQIYVYTFSIYDFY